MCITACTHSHPHTRMYTCITACTPGVCAALVRPVEVVGRAVPFAGPLVDPSNLQGCTSTSTRTPHSQDVEIGDCCANPEQWARTCEHLLPGDYATCVSMVPPTRFGLGVPGPGACPA